MFPFTPNSQNGKFSTSAMGDLSTAATRPKKKSNPLEKSNSQDKKSNSQDKKSSSLDKKLNFQYKKPNVVDKKSKTGDQKPTSQDKKLHTEEFKTTTYILGGKHKKQKSRVSREYRQNEEQVQKLLTKAGLTEDAEAEANDDNKETNQATGNGNGDDELNKNVEFFCRMWNDNQMLPKQSDGKKMFFDPWGSEGSAQQSDGSEPQSYPASAFLQIDALDLEVIQPIAAVKMVFNEADYYKPSETVPPKLEKRAEAMSKKSRRLVNRYCQEADQTGGKVAKNVVTKLKEADKKAKATKKEKPATRYRSNCGHKFHPVFCEPAAEPAEVPPRKFVKIYMKDLLFTKHPQLLEEHSVANELEELCTTYFKRLRARLCEKLEADLKTERKTANQLLAQASGEAGRSKDHWKPNSQQLETHLMAVKTLRNKLHKAEATNKHLLGDILKTWAKLKTLRRTQEFQCTRLQLKIKVDDSADIIARSHNWSQRYETELNEIYREQLEEYYRTKRDRKRATGRAANHRPIKPDIIKLAEELKKQLTEFSYLPTEPKVHIHLSRISEEEFCELPSGGLKKIRSYFMKIYLDKGYVGETRVYRVDLDLRVCFNESIGIFMERHMPKKIRFSLFEKTKLSKPRKIANIVVPITVEMQTDDFMNQNHAITLLPRHADARSQSYDGKLTVKFKFEKQLSPTAMNGVLFPPVKADSNNNGHTFSNRTFTVRDGVSGETDESDGGRGDSTGDSDGDGDDNASNKSALTLTLDRPKDTCTFEEDSLQFCDVQHLGDNRRLKLLQARATQSDARTKSLKLIPALDSELMSSGGHVVGDVDENVLVMGNWMDKIDVYKHEGKKYIRVLYEAMKIQCRRMNRAMHKSEDLLIGDDPSQWSSFFEALGWRFPRTPALNPSLGVNPHASIGPKDFKVMLNVVRATGIPVRDPYVMGERNTPKRSASNANIFLNQSIKYSNVKPFVSLSYRDKFTRSSTAEGSNPTWNEQLRLTLSGGLSDLHYDLKISLFDEVIENHMNDDLALRNADIYQRVQTNWLGECRIPISALIDRRKIDGVFELEMPKILIGYKSPSLDSLVATANPNDSTLLIDHEIKENIYMWLYLSIEPTFELPRIDTACLECAELREVRTQLQDWSVLVKQLRPERFIEPLVCTSQGKRVCLTRLLGAIPLPVEASENLLESACRFVSLLNVLQSHDECMHFEGVWLNNQVLLDSTACSPKDLGVLLCNYMLTIGIQCWLVLGLGNPYGESCFVLYRNDDADLYFIDPRTGKHYSTRDTFCPLQKVFYLVAPDNIYCNIQREERVCMTNYSLKDSSCWLPAFSKKSPAPMGGVHKLNYSYTQSESVHELKRNVERKIMKKLSTWRTMRKTTWNRAFQSRMEIILADLEDSVTFVSSSALRFNNVSHQLAAEFPNYNMYGFTLNFPYTNLSSVSEHIKSTGIHMNSDKNVEFALAVHIQVFPNNVLSLWVFLMSVVPFE